MKNFIQKLIIFTIPFLCFILISFIVFKVKQNNVQDEAEMIAQSECLLVGDSQMQRINPAFFSGKTTNIASSGEHFYFTYHKLKRILENKNNKVKKIVLGVSVHNFSPIYTKSFDVSMKEGKSSFERYFYFLPSYYSNDFSNFGETSLHLITKSLFKSAEWGGFYESENREPTKKIIDKTFEMHYAINEKDLGRNKFQQKKYLDKIDSLCTANKIQLFICSLPYHDEYKKQIEKKYFQIFNDAVDDLNSRSKINFLSESPDVTWMSDANHLSVDGAAIYSKKINQIITSSSN